MAETEGVIKFNLDYEARALDPVDIAELNAWRGILKQLGLLGQVPDRYDGYGFGNVSIRTERGFLISGTQTGGTDHVTLKDYALCTNWDLANNQVTAVGEIRPSSESLSHAAVYDVYQEVNCALHVHSPDIWSRARELGIAVTDESVPYGTPEMAREVRRHITGKALPGIFSMGGHEDGVFTYGLTLEDAGKLLISFLARARSLQRQEKVYVQQ